MKNTRFFPANSIVFISSDLEGPVPEPIMEGLVSYNSHCVCVGCYPEIDGETEFFLGKAEAPTEEFEVVFDGILKTPTKKLKIWTVDDEILLEEVVLGFETRVRVWVSHPRWPDKVVVGWG
jgi:hypothetical protein